MSKNMSVSDIILRKLFKFLAIDSWNVNNTDVLSDYVLIERKTDGTGPGST